MHQCAFSSDPHLAAPDRLPHLRTQRRPTAAGLRCSPRLSEAVACAGEDCAPDGYGVDFAELQPRAVDQHIVGILLRQITKRRGISALAVDLKRAAGFELSIEHKANVDGDLFGPHRLEARAQRGPRLL